MREAYAHERGTSEAMELGVASLWVGDYQAAWRHFRDFNDSFPYHATVTYGMAGVAQWCLRDRAEAIRQWRAGLRCAYADGAGGIRAPLLLYFASVAEPDLQPRAQVEEVLSTRATRPRAQMWPGPLAKFVLGAIDETQLDRECADPDPDEVALRHLESEFYRGVLAWAGGDPARFALAARKVGAISWQDYDSAKQGFLTAVWQEVTHLARYEVGSDLGRNS